MVAWHPADPEGAPVVAAPTIQAALINAEAELCRRSLYQYVKCAWPVVEPSTPFVDNWHIRLICEYLEALLICEVNDLIINVPPRHMKSLLVSVFFPTWSWIGQPGLSWLTGSYATPLAVRDALKSRRLIQSPWYRQRFGKSFDLRGDQNLKSRYENDRGGTRLTFGFNSAVTGEGGDVLVVDDPLRAQDADNSTQRARVNEIYDQTLSTRANDPKNARRVIIMQRLHQDDLTGHLLRKGAEAGHGQRIQHLCLPAEYSPRTFLPLRSLADPRKVEGEPLWPDRFGRAEIATARHTLGERGFAGQYDQRPYSEGGTIFQASWWQGENRYQAGVAAGNVVGRWISWDTALKEGEQNDFSAMVVMELMPDYRLRLREAKWGKYGFPQLAQVIMDEGTRWNFDEKLRGVIIEDKASGISALQTLEQVAPPEISGLLIAFQPGQRSKVGRARQASLWCERKRILLPEPDDLVPWLFEFEDQLARFPSARLNDTVDAFTQAILTLEKLLAEGWKAALGLAG